MNQLETKICSKPRIMLPTISAVETGYCTMVMSQVKQNINYTPTPCVRMCGVYSSCINSNANKGG